MDFGSYAIEVVDPQICRPLRPLEANTPQRPQCYMFFQNPLQILRGPNFVDLVSLGPNLVQTQNVQGTYLADDVLFSRFLLPPAPCKLQRCTDMFCAIALNETSFMTIHRN